jgi:hypothetical protein
VTISKKKNTEKKKTEKEKKYISKAKILPTYHSSIHEAQKLFNKRTYLPTNRTPSSVCCHFHPLTWWMKKYVHAGTYHPRSWAGGMW